MLIVVVVGFESMEIVFIFCFQDNLSKNVIVENVIVSVCFESMAIIFRFRDNLSESAITFFFVCFDNFSKINFIIGFENFSKSTIAVINLPLRGIATTIGCIYGVLYPQ
jgi:hypothetical protein